MGLQHFLIQTESHELQQRSHIQNKADLGLCSCGGRLCAAAAPADSLSWRLDAAAHQTPASSCDAPNYPPHN